MGQTKFSSASPELQCVFSENKVQDSWLLGNSKPSPQSSEAGAFAGDSTAYQGILALSSVETR